MTWVPGLDTGSLSLALSAGLVAAVNPCGFALLPAYLSLFVLGDEPRSTAVAVGRALRATTALTLGFAAVFVAFGLAIAPVAASVQSYLPAFTVALGLVLALAGLWLLAGRRLPSLPSPRPRKAAAGSPMVTSWPAITGFGASYAVASLGCTIAPFLAVVVTSFRSGSPAAGVVLFAAYAAGMGLTVGVAATAVALARLGLVTSMRRAGAVVPRLGGLLLAAAGGYVAWYGAWELRVLHGGAGADPVVSAAARIQEWLATRTEAIGATGLALALTALLAVGLIPHHHRHRGRSGTNQRTEPDWPLSQSLSTPQRARIHKEQAMRMQAIFNGVVIAESDDTIVVEGNHYFPEESLNEEFFTPTSTHTLCPWKGIASYYTVEVDGLTSADAAWYYPKPSPLARRVKGRVAFWRGVEVRRAPERQAS